MIKKILKSQKGSTLTMVLMSLSVLSILGTAIMSSAVMNLKVKMHDKSQKTSFYLSEAGLEEAYAIMMYEVDRAIKAGNTNVQNNLQNFIVTERAKEHKQPPEQPINSVFIDGDGSVNEENIKIKMQEWFANGYTDYLNKKDDTDSTLNLLKKRLEESSNYSILDNNIDSSKPDIDAQGNINEYPNVPPMQQDLTQTQLDTYKEELKNYMEEDNNKFKITLSSKFTHDSIDKEIKSTFSISIPEYNTPYYIGNEVLTLKENILWTKALIADKNIVVEGNDVNINGDIYAYGDSDIEGNTRNIYDDIEDEYKKNDKYKIENSGIIVGNDSKQGDLTVNGNVITNGYLQTKEDGSNITLNNGEVYCNSLVIPKEQKSCNINTNGNVNTFDDVELNGSKSNININGNYYGFTYGATGHDKSSSIIINSGDIGKGSSISITGDGEPKEYYGTTDEAGKGTFIAGTVYIDLDVDYQTGESVSVKGNYRGYAETLDSGEYAKDKVEFGYFPPLYLMDHIKNSSDPTYKQRGEYLKAVYDNGSSILNLGNGSIDIQNVKYSLGDYIRKQENKVSLERGIFALDYTDVFDKNRIEYNYYVNQMGDTQTALADAFDDQSLVSERLEIENRFNFDQNINKNIDNKEIFFANDRNETLSIIGSNADNPKNNANYTINTNEDGVLKGIIIAKGDIYISGKINFIGMIVTEGNIYIQDDQEKIFTNDYNTNLNNNYVINKIAEDRNLITEGTQIGDLFTQDSGWSKEVNIYLDKMGVDSEVKTYYKFSDLITITEWKKIKN